MPFPAQFNLSDLNGNNGFVINGIDSDDRSGRSVSSAGDINGDGVDDLIIGAPLADPNGNDRAGESYVVFGSSSFSQSLDLSSLNGSNGFFINGVDTYDYSGFSVSSAGDINGDGLDDVIIGADSADPNGNEDAGKSYVVFGSSSFSQNLDLSSLNGSNGFVINGIDAYDYSGFSVSSAGDINGDGLDDLIIGAIYADPNGNEDAGESYVVFGSSSFSKNLDLSTLNGSNGFVINGIDTYDYSGFSVSSAGDINGDGLDDLIIGAIYADPNGNEDAGESYVVFGSSSFSQNLDLSTLNGSNGFVINGIDSFDLSGGSVSSAGDINGDGIDDVIIGAYIADPNGNEDAGESYVVFGSSSFSQNLDLSTLNGSNGFVINGIDSGDFSGISVSSAGDINSDGIDDLIIGADAAGSSSSGESYVVFGSNSGFSQSLDLSSLNGSNGFAINGINTDDYSGFSVSGAGDINGDGVDDVIIGARNADPNGTEDAGESYVVFGANIVTGTNSREVLDGESSNDIITGLQGRDILTGGGGADQFVYTSVIDAGDIIKDFELGSDTIVLTELLDSIGYTGSDAIGDGIVTFGASGSDARVQIDTDGAVFANFARTLVTVQNVTVADISDSSNFVF